MHPIQQDDKLNYGLILKDFHVYYINYHPRMRVGNVFGRVCL